MKGSSRPLLILKRNIVKGFDLEEIAMSANRNRLPVKKLVNWDTTDPVKSTILIATVLTEILTCLPSYTSGKFCSYFSSTILLTSYAQENCLIRFLSYSSVFRVKP